LDAPGLSQIAMHPQDRLLSSPQWLLRTLNAGGVTAAVGGMALLMDQVWLVPSLGPSILMQCYMPRSPESRLYPLAVGQLLGVVAGLVAVGVVGLALGLPPADAGPGLHPNQVAAAVIALLLTLLLQILLRALHPPAASTAMLWALGQIPVSLGQVAGIGGAIALVAAVGEPVRRWEAKRLPKDRDSG
jgi:hypothetical protein